MKENILFLGLGSENFALIRWLSLNGDKSPITVWDSASPAELGERYEKLKSFKNISWKFSKRLPPLSGYALILRSPGVYLSPAQRKQLAGTLSCPMDLFLKLCPSKNIIGVTGTKGKGTTSSLIYSILRASGKRAWLGGNIGVAPFSFINKIKARDWVILELSSFQLEDMRLSPRIAVITNFTPEHLSLADPKNPNHHPSLAAYWEAKFKITRYQSKNDFLIINRNLRTKAKKSKANKIFFGASALSSRLPGKHNKENIAAAVEAARLARVSQKIIERAVKNFSGLEYRLQKIALKKEVEYYNDSFATTPEATETALRSFSQPIILLAGGADKGANFKRLARLIKRRVKFVILFKGKATPRLEREIKKAGFPTEVIKRVSSMKEAVRQAKTASLPGDIILLSPACASFGLFKNYKDRGKQFTQAVLS